jgi:hypothetical protein
LPELIPRVSTQRGIGFQPILFGTKIAGLKGLNKSAWGIAHEFVEGSESPARARQSCFALAGRRFLLTSRPGAVPQAFMFRPFRPNRIHAEHDWQDAYATLVDRQDAYPTFSDRQDAYPTLVDRQDAYPTFSDRQDAYPTFYP